MVHKKSLYILKHALISWFIFSVLYGIAAYYKPFHVDEFFSWVYAERCTFSEIIQLKEFGIGHPPLYHLIQKIVQTFMPSYHFLYVRLANYLFGSLFIILFVKIFLRYKNIPLFCYGVAFSATTLDLFIFSRMWGLVCLFSLLLLWVGEIYYHKPNRKALIFLLTFAVFGFLSDYNFILLFPYVAIVLFSRKPYFKRLLIFFLVFLVLSWLTSNCLSVISKGASFSQYFFQMFNDLKQLSCAIITVFFNFWFKETLLVALIVFLAVFVFSFKSKDKRTKIKQYINSPAQFVLVGIIILTVLNLLSSHEFVFFRNIAPGILLLVFVFLKSRKMNILDMSMEKNRIIITIFIAALIILSVSPIFWRSLTNHRFVLILFPYLLLLVVIILNKKDLYALSIILTFSGIIYLFSTGVSNFYPPMSNDKNRPLFFEDAFCYTTQHLKPAGEDIAEPVIFDPLQFNKYCKLCKTGKTKIDFSDYDKFWIIGNYDSVFPISNFELIKKDVSLNWLDRLQFKYLTPFSTGRFALFEYHRIIK